MLNSIDEAGHETKSSTAGSGSPSPEASDAKFAGAQPAQGPKKAVSTSKTSKPTAKPAAKAQVPAPGVDKTAAKPPAQQAQGRKAARGTEPIKKAKPALKVKEVVKVGQSASLVHRH